MENNYQLSDIIDSIDIVEYISQFVELEEKNGEFWGLSPFKNEKTPSFSVRKDNQSFYCFSSGIGGNVFTFVKYYRHCGAREAKEILLSYLKKDGKDAALKPKLSATMVCRQFASKSQPLIAENGTKKAAFGKDYMSRFEKRDDKLSVWEGEGISREVLDKFQVRYDAFSDRLVYPIRNLDGDIVNIGGRTLDPEWKEKRLRKYTYFSRWGEMDVIYGVFENLESIMEKKEIIIFEGCKSVLKAQTWDIDNTGALLTSHLSPRQKLILVRLGVRVVFALDKEVDIKKDRNIGKLKRWVDVEYLWDKSNLIEDKDSPVDHGKEVFEALYQQRLKYR